jgi:hypothetical protein
MRSSICTAFAALRATSPIKPAAPSCPLLALEHHPCAPFYSMQTAPSPRGSALRAAWRAAAMERWRVRCAGLPRAHRGGGGTRGGGGDVQGWGDLGVEHAVYEAREELRLVGTVLRGGEGRRMGREGE